MYRYLLASIGITYDINIIKIIKRGPVTSFLSLIFSSNNSNQAPKTQIKAFFYLALYSQRYSSMKKPFLVVSGVDDTANHKKWYVVNPYIFCTNVVTGKYN
jgi:hypothetical protein